MRFDPLDTDFSAVMCGRRISCWLAMIPTIAGVGDCRTDPYTPGHCVDHLAVVLESGEAFCGDAAASFLLLAGTRYCTVFMTDMNDAYRSWGKMLDAGARMIYPAHGRPFPAGKLRQNMGCIKNESLAVFF
jgi:hypothetical protein